MKSGLSHLILALLLCLSFTTSAMHNAAAQMTPSATTSVEMSMPDCHSMAEQDQSSVTPESPQKKMAAHDCVNCLGCACSFILAGLKGSLLLRPAQTGEALQAPLSGKALPVDLQPPRILTV